MSREEKIPRGYTRVPPDGGWAWVVLFGCCFAGLTTMTVSTTFGVILSELTTMFSTSTSTLSWVSSVSVAAGMFLGPLYTVIINTYGCRRAVIFGGILLSFGITASYFTYSIELFILTYGFIAGMGAGLTQGAYPVVLSRYFKKYYGFANGCLTSSFAVSKLFLTPVEQLVVSTYGCRASFLIMGANVLHICIGGCLLQPARWHSLLVPEIVVDGGNRNTGNGTVTVENHFSRTAEEDKKQGPEELLAGSESPVKAKLLPNNNSHSCNSLCYQSAINETTAQALGQFAASVETMDIICTTAYMDSDDESSEETSDCSRWCSKGPLKTIDHSVWKDPMFYVICLNGSLLLTVLLYSMLFLFPLGVEMGLTPMQTASMISGKAFADIFGRLVGPTMITMAKLPTRFSFIALNAISAVILGVMSLAQSYEAFIALSISFGVISGAVIGLNGVLIVECMGAKRLSSVIGLSSFIKGFIMLPMAPIMGWIRDMTGSFKDIFMLLSILQILVAILWTAKPLIIKLRR